ncbi:hypothetical protein ACFT8P_32735 [Streptomyces sp. NPDC057101]|uniref:hypothetical protein n=1 Tax=Streptomyces sp. NPDC057101 TaxID=3346020 RepID=UPI003632CFD9
MTLHYLPTVTPAEPEDKPVSDDLPFLFRTDPPEPVAEPEEREPWQGEAEALAEAEAVGRRAAAWVRSLPLPAGAWISGPLADAVEEAMTGLDLADCDDIGHRGHAGVSESARERLNGLIYAMAETVPLAAHQKVALFAVVHWVQGLPQTLANDPGTVFEGGGLAAVCAPGRRTAPARASSARRTSRTPRPAHRSEIPPARAGP